MNYPFDTTELATLDSGDSLSAIIQLRGLMRGIQIENRTPAFWQVVDDSGTVWFKIPPWSITQGRFPESQQVVIETEPNSPLFSLSTVTDTEYRLGYELFREALPYQVMNLVTGLVQLTGSLPADKQGNYAYNGNGTPHSAYNATVTSGSNLTIWTPSVGKVFRALSLMIGVSAAGEYEIADGIGSWPLYLSAGSNPIPLPPGGWLGETGTSYLAIVNNTASSVAIGAIAFGDEE